MIGFNTVLPLSNQTSVEQFLALCRKWMKNSPHTSLNIDFDKMKYHNEFESLELVDFKGEQGIHCGARYIKKDSDCEWRTDVVGYKTKEHFKVAIVTSRANFKVETYSSLPIKPYIVKLLVEETYQMYDDNIAIEAKAKEVNSENVSEIISVINSISLNTLPVVYVSVTNTGEYLVDYNILARKLSGLAHVYVEKNKAVSQLIREETFGKNSYNGNIGIYWPGGKSNYYYRREKENHINNIIDFIKKTLNSRKTEDEYRWSFVQNLKYRSILERYQQGESELNDILEYANQDNKELNEQVKELEAEISYLKQMNQDIIPSHFNMNSPLIMKGLETELFPNEHLELVRRIIEEKIQSGGCSTRTKNILESILSANIETNNRDEFIDSIKVILSSPRGLTKQGKRELIRKGFELKEDGRHYKLKIKGDDRYSHPISKTPSDSASSLNNFSAFKKHFL